jgi:serine/threonine protein kinase
MVDADPGHDQLEVLASDFLARLRRGERPSIAAYARRNPALAAEIRELFPTVRAAEHIKHPHGQWLQNGDGEDNADDQLTPFRPKRISHGGGDRNVGSEILPSQGMQLGKYVLQQCVGDGSLSSVWRAEHPEFGIPVAVKILHDRPSSGSESEDQQFLSEARVAALLNHPHVIRVFDAGVDHGLKYLVMEFVSGGTVADLQARLGGKLPIRQATSIASAVVDALSTASSLGIVHRDIKPENILLDQDGQPKLADMGLAKETRGTEQAAQSRQIMGTPLYLSPEQAMGCTDVDVRTDIYSLGATLYHLVTGEPPFDGPTLHDVFRGHLHEGLVAPHQRNPEVPTDLSKIICRMMEKRPADRYQSTADLRAELDKFLAEYRDAPSSSARQFFRSPCGVILGIGFLMLVLAFVYWALPVRNGTADKSVAMGSAESIPGGKAEPFPGKESGSFVFRPQEWQIVEGRVGLRETYTRALNAQDYRFADGVLLLDKDSGNTWSLVYEKLPLMGPFRIAMEVKGSNTIGIVGVPGEPNSSCQAVLLNPKEFTADPDRWHIVEFHRERDTIECRADGEETFSLSGSQLAHGRLWIGFSTEGTCAIRQFEASAEPLPEMRGTPPLGGGRPLPPRP